MPVFIQRVAHEGARKSGPVFDVLSTPKAHLLSHFELEMIHGLRAILSACVTACVRGDKVTRADVLNRFSFKSLACAKYFNVDLHRW